MGNHFGVLITGVGGRFFPYLREERKHLSAYENKGQQEPFFEGPV